MAELKNQMALSSGPNFRPSFSFLTIAATADPIAPSRPPASAGWEGQQLAPYGRNQSAFLLLKIRSKVMAMICRSKVRLSLLYAGRCTIPLLPVLLAPHLVTQILRACNKTYFHDGLGGRSRRWSAKWFFVSRKTWGVHRRPGS